MIRPLIILALCTASVIIPWHLGYAHDAPTGWSYPFSCCSNHDCRAVSEGQVRETKNGYVIASTGELIPYSGDTRLKESPDGMTHWCSVAGANDSRTICLFVPPKSY